MAKYNQKKHSAKLTLNSSSYHTSAVWEPGYLD